MEQCIDTENSLVVAWHRVWKWKAIANEYVGLFLEWRTYFVADCGYG